MSFIRRLNFFFLLLPSTMGALRKVKSMIKTEGMEFSFYICIVRASKVRRNDFCCDNKQYKQMFISYLDNRSTVSAEVFPPSHSGTPRQSAS